jgi:hypothetical protein
MNKELSAGTTDEQRIDADNSTSASLVQNGLLSAAWSIEKVAELRNQLPTNWKWEKCYELAYISSRTGREFIKKHWALKELGDETKVCSLGMISHDSNQTKKEFFNNDIPVQFVEKSLEIIDFLLAEIKRMEGSR